MPLCLYFDTETCDYSEDDAPSLPCELAFVLADEERTYASIGVIIDQTHWVGIRGANPIAERVWRKHGVTPERASAYGVAPDVILNIFRLYSDLADVVVAHNISFDVNVMNHAFRTQQLPPVSWPRQYCTMRESAAILKLPAFGRFRINGYKAPRLGEAYKHFTTRELQNAHNALNDVFACKLVHKGILREQTLIAAGLGAPRVVE